MKSIRRFSFVAVLILGVLSQFVGLAHAQESMQGKFSLPYEVRWEKAVVPAGDYGFSLQHMGPFEILTLQKVSGGARYGFFMMIHSSEPAKPTGLGSLVLVTKGDQRFVSSMQMARSGETFYFSVPDEPEHSAKQIARAEAVTASPAAR
jgi:hypothetical protein